MHARMSILAACTSNRADFSTPPGRNSNTTHPTSALLNPFSLAVAIIALLILPLFIWQYITISCQLAEYEVSKRQAYDSGGLAFSSGVARSIAPNENRQAWIDGFDAAAKVDSALKFQAEIAEQDHRKTIEAKTLEDAERIADLQRKAKIFVACDEHLEATYRKSGKYSTRLQDLYAINQAVENAETAWETSMQRKLLEGLYTAIELDEYEQVKNILLQYGLNSFDDWRALTTLASSNGW